MDATWFFLGYLAAGYLMGELTCWACREVGHTLRHHEYLVSVFCWPLFVPSAIRLGVRGWL